MKLPQAIRHARKALRRKQSELAVACGWPDSNSRVSHYESDEREISQAVLLELAAGFKSLSGTVLKPEIIAQKLLASDFSWIPDGVAEQPLKPYTKSKKPTQQEVSQNNASDGPTLRAAKEVPVVGRAKGGADGYFEEEQYPVGHGSEYVMHATRDPNAFALRIEGDSMFPRIRDGEFVVVEPNSPGLPGDDVYVALKDGRKLVKTLKWRASGKIELLSVNNQFDPIVVALDEVDAMYRIGGILPARSAFERF